MESLLEGTELHDLARRELKKSFDLRNYLSLFALILTFLDSIWLIKSEYRFIWPAPWGPRFLYLWSRYVALATLIAHYVFVHVVLSEGPVSLFRCQVWFAVLAVSCVSLQCALDAILILRIYALYLRNPKIFILLTLVAIPYLIAFILVVRNVLKEDAFNRHCDLKHTPIEAVPLGVMTILSHLAMWLATYSRRNIAEGRATVVNLVVKGGHWALALLFLIPSTMIPYSFASHSVNPFIIFVLPVALISITSCRVLISMRSFKVESAEEFPLNTHGSVFRATTVISISQNSDNDSTQAGCSNK